MNNELPRRYILALLACTSIPQISDVLYSFSVNSQATLLDRAKISAAYTPRAFKLLQNLDEHQKWKKVEDLAALCWTKQDTDIFSSLEVRA